MEEIMNSIGPALTFCVGIATCWFTYVIINVIVTFFNAKKLDKSLTFCFNQLGKIFYAAMTLLYVVTIIGSIYFIVVGFTSKNWSYCINALNVLGFVTIVYAWQLSSIVLVGRKSMMIGRLLVDYRKIKKLNFGYTQKVSFVYSQQEYAFSVRFVDLTELKKRLAV